MANFWGNFSSGFGSGFQLGRAAIQDAENRKRLEEEAAWRKEMQARQKEEWARDDALRSALADASGKTQVVEGVRMGNDTVFLDQMKAEDPEKYARYMQYANQNGQGSGQFAVMGEGRGRLGLYGSMGEAEAAQGSMANEESRRQRIYDAYAAAGQIDKAEQFKASGLQAEAAGLSIKKTKDELDTKDQKRALAKEYGQNRGFTQELARYGGDVRKYIASNIDAKNLAPGQTVESVTDQIMAQGGQALGLLSGPTAQLRSGYDYVNKLMAVDENAAREVKKELDNQAGAEFTQAVLNGNTKLATDVANLFPNGMTYKDIKISEKGGRSVISATVIGADGKPKKQSMPMAEFLAFEGNRLGSQAMVNGANLIIQRENRDFDEWYKRSVVDISRREADAKSRYYDSGGTGNKPIAYGVDADGTPVFQQGTELIRADKKPIADMSKVRRTSAEKPQMTMTELKAAEEVLRQRYPDFDAMPKSKQDELRNAMLGEQTTTFNPLDIPPPPVGGNSAIATPPKEEPWYRRGNMMDNRNIDLRGSGYGLTR